MSLKGQRMYYSDSHGWFVFTGRETEGVAMPGHPPTTWLEAEPFKWFKPRHVRAWRSHCRWVAENFGPPIPQRVHIPKGGTDIIITTPVLPAPPGSPITPIKFMPTKKADES